MREIRCSMTFPSSVTSSTLGFDLLLESIEDVDLIERTGETDPGVGPLAVEVGRHQEPLVRQRVAVGHPGGGTGAELESSPAAPGHRQPIGKGQRQDSARPGHRRTQPGPPSEAVAGLDRRPAGHYRSHIGRSQDIGGAMHSA